MFQVYLNFRFPDNYRVIVKLVKATGIIKAIQVIITF